MPNQIDYVGKQTLTRYDKNIKEYIYSLLGTGNGMAGLFDIAMPDTYDIQPGADTQQVIADALNLDSFQTTIGSSGISWKRPTIIVPTIQWSDTVDENYNLSANVEVAVLFSDNSAVKKTVTFRKPGPGKLVAIMTTDGAYVDTGLTMDYSYRFKAKGHTQGGTLSVLIGAYSSNATRTTLRMLGGSQKFQSMWPNNRELTGATAGMNLSKVLEYDQNGSRLIVSQDGRDYTFTYTNNTSGTADIPILLMSEETNSTTYNNGVLYYAEIYDGNDVLLRQFMPFKLSNGDIVVVDVAGLTAQQIYDIVQNGTSAEYGSRVYYPVTGSFAEAV